MTSRVILFEFAGRKANMTLQLPFIRRILDEHPNVECQLWNLARTSADADYVSSISGDRITVRGELLKYAHQVGWNRVYKTYVDEPGYEGSVFVKLDDDVLFLQTERFGTFIDAIQAHPGNVLSADVINNGACTPTTPALYDHYKALNIPLLDVHKNNEFAAQSHAYFFAQQARILTAPLRLIPTKDWLSINAVGYDWTVAQGLADIVGTVPHPSLIAGRRFPPPWGLGDEGACNTFPRIIMKGFTAGHLGFGPQHLTAAQADRWRQQYSSIGNKYLDAGIGPANEKLPELAETSWGFRGEQPYSEEHANKELTDWAIRSGWTTKENDPTAGRFKE